MRVEPERSFDELEELVSQTPTIHRLIATPVANVALADLDFNPTDEIVIAIGPEGGFTDEEQNLISGSGWQAVSLGSYIFRIETAAIAATVLITAQRDPQT